MPAVAVPIARGIQTGGASSSGGTAVDMSQPHPTPQPASQCFIGGTVEAELGRLVTFFQGNTQAPGDASHGMYKRSKVKAVEALVGERASVS